ncbi:MAG: PIN domain-containing protein [Lachnospiraceae bacterium]
MAKTKRVYLVDTENVNDLWVNLLDRIDVEDKIVVFYTNNSPHMCVEKVVRLMKFKRSSCISWIKCFEGSNALDFQLVTQLGAMIAKNQQNEYVIVSNDNGFEAVVKYWQKNSLHVTRIKGNECKFIERAPEKPRAKASEQPKSDVMEPSIEKVQGTAAKSSDKVIDLMPEKFSEKKAEAVSETISDEGMKMLSEETPEKRIEGVEEGLSEKQIEAAFEESSEKNAEVVSKELSKKETETVFEEQSDQEQREADQETRLNNPFYFLDEQRQIECVLQLSKSISTKKLSTLHSALARIFGQEDGKRIYRLIKEHREVYPIFTENYLPEKDERVKAYVTLIFYLAGFEESDLDAVTELYLKIENHDLQALNTAIQSAFEKDKAKAYYKVIKTHNQVLQAL